MYKLQILHASDLEGGVDAIESAPNFAAIVDALEADAAGSNYASILLSAGDNYIPGPFFNAGGDFNLNITFEGFYNALFGLIDTGALASVNADADGNGFFDNAEIETAIDANLITFAEAYTTDVNGDGFFDYFEEIDNAPGRMDIAIMNRLGFDATAVGNHEFDAGTGAFGDAIEYDSEEGNSLSTSRYADTVAGHVNFLQEVDNPGAQFPYLSANLDFSQDGGAGSYFTDVLQDSTNFQSDLASARVDVNDPSARGSDSRDSKIAPATIVTTDDGEQIGVVGATTQLVSTISSTGSVEDQTSPGINDMPALAALLQPQIDDLIAQGVNKIIVTSHLQQIALEQELAGLLSGVDVIIAGGSDTLLADSNDTLRSGDTADGDYPFQTTNKDGEPLLIVSTDGEYSYVGRLVVTFDDQGVIDVSELDDTVSGAFATDEAGVLRVTGDADLATAIANSDKATDVANLTDAVSEIVTTQDGDIAGEASVYLNGERGSVRTEETNFGNLTADANLAAAKTFDADVLVSIKNGGGIRAAIGEIVDNGDGTATRTITSANPLSGKEAGEVSELDIDNALRFNNGLSIVELTPAEFKIVLEHAVAATAAGATPGQFPQIGGFQFSFDPAGTAQVLDNDGNVATAGTRVQNVALLNEDGSTGQAIIANGKVVPGAPAIIKTVTLDFLAGGGDGYPFSDFSDVTDTGIREQGALSDFLTDNFPKDGPDAFSEADTAVNIDNRIQNLSERVDTIGAPELEFEVVAEFQGEFSGDDPEGASEVVSHEDGKLYVTNGEMDRIDIFTIDQSEEPDFIDLADLDGYDGVQSVDIKNGVVAAAIARAPVEKATIFGTTLVAQVGFVALFDAESKELLSTIDVGVLPDNLSFNADGTQLVVAGEGEYNEDSIDDGIVRNPLGTVAVIDTTDPANPAANILDFTEFNGFEELARNAGIRIQEGETFGADVEPEYVSISPDGTTAFVSLQENNAIAKIDLSTGATLDIFSLGTVDFGSESKLDANDNGEIDIRNFDNLVGFRMADAITSYEVGGKTYVLTANEGDSRDFDEDRVSDLAEDGKLDPALKAQLLADGLIDEDDDTDIGLERLEVSTIDGDTDGDGDIDVLHTFSSRSFSIFDEDGNLVFDSGPEFEQLIASIAPDRFNDDDGDRDGDEDRSDAKGPEPEAIAVGEVDGRTYAFIGLERDSGIMIYDVTDPANSSFVNYIPPKFVDDTAEEDVARHSPEVIKFIPAEESGTGNAQIAVAYEVSGTTIVYDLKPAEEVQFKIGDIQGAGHVSALVGEEVTTTGIVTAVDRNGFYLQDEGDGDDHTSDAIFVYTGSRPTVEVGDEAKVTGTVSEFIPGGASTGNLSTTQISANSSAAVIDVLSSGNALPAAVVIGASGRTPPTDVVISEDELPVNLQNEPGDFNPETDGIDFYESLEGMRVTVEDASTVSATNRFNETWVVANNGENVTSGSLDGGLNDRGGLNLNADEDGYGDLNPERIQIQYDSDLLPEGFDAPDLDLGTQLGDVTGVVGYGFGNFEVIVTDPFDVVAESQNEAEITSIAGDSDTLTVATYNILNVTVDLDGSGGSDDDAAQIAQLAQQIVNNLGSPDILALQEIQDDSGVTDDGTLSAENTLQAIVDAIVAAGGPRYAFESAVVDQDGENGGVPGGNIRNAFLYNADRVDAQEFVTLESDVLASEFGLDDTVAGEGANAFDGTRDPLLGVFTFNGETVTLVNNHLTSRFGSSPIFGAEQPFVQAGEAEREQQALALNQVVDALLAADPEARVSVLGDLNTFDFTDELTVDLPGEDGVLSNLIEQLEGDEAYTFVFQGNSQVLDHVFVTDGLLNGAEVDIVHVNNDFVDFASDHEPVVVSFKIEQELNEIVGTDRGERIFGTLEDDKIEALGGNDRVFGFDGDDMIDAGRGRDRVFAGEGDDMVSGGRGRDSLFGDDGNDKLSGDGGADRLFGEDGDDIIIGGRGNDRSWGGEGADIFVYDLDSKSTDRDRIYDFDPGEDKIDLQGLDITELDQVGIMSNRFGTTLDLGDAGRVVLLGVDEDEIDSDDFIFKNDAMV